jgi:aldose 1-epimerase
LEDRLMPARAAATLVLQDSRIRVGIVPEMGGGLAFATALLPDGNEAAVLRPWSRDGAAGPFALASNVLVPFSNRISGGGFSFDGVFHPIAPNLEGEPFPVHGDGYQKVWTVEQARDGNATLTLGGEIGPFRYDARQDFRIEGGALRIALTVASKSPRPLPFGAGFHPWFPRLAGTALRFRAKQVWLEDARHLPADRVEIAARPAWDFSATRPLPADWINNAFAGWDGLATIIQPGLGIAVDIEASANLDVALLYSPGPQSGFFCFEPVSHPVDAHNLPGRPGLQTLAEGQSLSAGMTLRWSAL